MGQALCVCARGTVSIGGARYLLLHRLAEGGFSCVDLVEGLRDGRLYALKRIACHDAEDRQAALREAEMHGLLRHPNVLRLEAHCLLEKGAKHEAWLLLPYVQGGTLWGEVEALREKGVSMPEQRSPPHPPRHLLRAAGHPQQGLRAQVGAHSPAPPTAGGLEGHGRDWAAQRCTISYRAPELFTVPSQCVIDERTDIWSLGCVLYCMMFGEGPYDMVFQKGDSVALAGVPLPHWQGLYSAALHRLLCSMMAVNPQERPSIDEVLQQLEELQPAPAGQVTTCI
uniref:non-specific serine/threonine protein kinase n=1 Tax=Anas platyrhynchos TaxID=8839 RepID=A0A8B9SLS1_ANAPL